MVDTTFNLFADDWDRLQDRPGYQSRTTSVGARIGASRIGASLYELDPGEKTWPYHAHHANEEWLVVLLGRPTLRDAAGERELEEGDIVCFPRGPSGAHQVLNRSDVPVRVLLLSTKVVVEVVEYPDSDKIGVSDPGTGLRGMLRGTPQVDYWEGE